MKNNEKITCTVEMTEGAEQRITEAFVELYYKIKDGICQGPLLEVRKDKPA